MKTKHHGDLLVSALIESLRKTTLPFFEKHFGNECTEAEMIVIAAIDFLESIPVSLTEQIANDPNIDAGFRSALASQNRGSNLNKAARSQSPASGGREKLCECGHAKMPHMTRCLNCCELAPAPAEQAGDEERNARKLFKQLGLKHWDAFWLGWCGRAAPTLDAQKADTTQARDAWQPIETAPKDGLIDLCAGERIYSQCYYDSICDEYRRLDHWNRLEMLKLRNGFTHWRWSQLPPAAIAKETTK